MSQFVSAFMGGMGMGQNSANSAAQLAYAVEQARRREAQNAQTLEIQRQQEERLRQDLQRRIQEEEYKRQVEQDAIGATEHALSGMNLGPGMATALARSPGGLQNRFLDSALERRKAAESQRQSEILADWMVKNGIADTPVGRYGMNALRISDPALRQSATGMMSQLFPRERQADPNAALDDAYKAARDTIDASVSAARGNMFSSFDPKVVQPEIERLARLNAAYAQWRSTGDPTPLTRELQAEQSRAFPPSGAETPAVPAQPIRPAMTEQQMKIARLIAERNLVSQGIRPTPEQIEQEMSRMGGSRP